MSGDLVAFLRARLDEDEALARRALESPWETASDDYRGLKDEILVVWHSDPAAELFLRHDPARVLREVEAKRAILRAECSPYPKHAPPMTYTLRQLAAVYSGHPGYRQEWAPAAITSPPS